MKKGFYPKLAVNGIMKNRETYFPYLLTCIGMVMMYYIISFLSVDPGLASMSGGSQMAIMLAFGVHVIAVFAVIFLYYTNSFLIRRRKKEFGLYNILGMNKWNLSRILIYETIICYLIAVVLGTGCGILFSRLAQFLMLRIMGSGALTFQLQQKPIVNTVILFAAIFGIIFLNTLRQIHVSNPIELLHSEQTGEKPPKANWVLALLGAVLLGIAYYLAITIQSPIEAMLWFFVAVVLVILATYLLFIAGSVSICVFLRKCKNYYYKTNHFVSTSFMGYRMKRNGAGLASICILSTMVLVMISSTTCLFIGEESILQKRYARDILINVTYQREEQTQACNALIQQKLEECGLGPENSLHYRCAGFSCFRSGNELITNWQRAEEEGLGDDNYWVVYLIPVEYYNTVTGSHEALAEDEVLLCVKNSGAYTSDTVVIEGCAPMHVKAQVDGIDDMEHMEIAAKSMYLFVPGIEPIEDVRNTIAAQSDGQTLLVIRDVFGYDLQGDNQKQIEAGGEIGAELLAYTGLSADGVRVETLAENRGDFYAIYGGLFFLGILLGIVFVFAVALIMYYKQIIEGHEDSGRFEILQKVGMTETEVKKSINSSVLTVFFLPLVVAGVHVLAAFPIISKLLLLFGLTDTKLFLLTLLGCFLLFSVFYTVMYTLTSKAYYRIVRRK